MHAWFAHQYTVYNAVYKTMYMYFLMITVVINTTISYSIVLLLAVLYIIEILMYHSGYSHCKNGGGNFPLGSVKITLYTISYSATKQESKTFYFPKF